MRRAKAPAGAGPGRPEPARIAFWGNFGSHNWGNECTLQAIVHNARQRLPDAELVCICTEPTDTEKRHGLPGFPISSLRREGVPGVVPPRRLPKPLRVLRRAVRELREWKNTIAVARKLDAVIMTGTGMLTDDSEGAFGLPYDLFKWALATKVFGGKVMFSSVGVEPILTPAARFFIVSALRLADYRSYRDLQSRQHLERVGFKDARDEVFPDLAFSLPRPGERAGAGTGGAGTVASAGAGAGAGAVASAGAGTVTGAAAGSGVEAAGGGWVAVGIYNYRGRGTAGGEDARVYRSYLEKIASFIGWLLSRGFRVRVIIGDLAYDEPVLHDLRAVLDAKGLARQPGRLEDEPAASVQAVLDQIAGVDVVVASRFHNVLLALFLGKPVVSISYNEKNDALMAATGLGKYCQTIDDFDLDRLKEQFSEVQSNAGALRGAIAGTASAFRDQLDRQYRTLFGETAPVAAEPDARQHGKAESPSPVTAPPAPSAHE